MSNLTAPTNREYQMLMMEPTMEIGTPYLRETRLDERELRYWIDFYDRSTHFPQLRRIDYHGHICVYMDGIFVSPIRPVLQEVHAEGYERYLAYPDRLPRDSAGRRILGEDVDKTQLPGARGVAWVTYNQVNGVHTERDLTGLMYELSPNVGRARTWRELPVSELLQPDSVDTVLSREGIDLLDSLESEGATITELSGLSVRKDAQHQGLIYHEIMRRMVHQGIATYLETGRENIMLFVIVQETRDRIGKRMGPNFVDIGDPLPPSDDNPHGQTRLVPGIIRVPHIIRPRYYLDNQVAAYRQLQAQGRRPSLTLVNGIRLYTDGLAPEYLAEYPAMVQLLTELPTPTR